MQGSRLFIHTKWSCLAGCSSTSFASCSSHRNLTPGECAKLTAVPDRSRARELAADYMRRGDPTGWFEALYREGDAGHAEIPWDDRKPGANLLEFWRTNGFPG